MISLNNVSYSINGTDVLIDNNLIVNKNEYCAIIGPNGGGKTTLLKIMLGLLHPVRGQVRIMGKEPRKALRYIGYVPQLLNVNDNFPVRVIDVVLMGLLGQKGNWSKGKRYEEAYKALNMLKMDKFADRHIGSLSGGQKQRVFFARALIRQPEILLLDEPASGIEPLIKRDIFNMLIKLKEKMTIVLVTHDISIVTEHIDKLGCLSKYLHVHTDKKKFPQNIQMNYQCPVDLFLAEERKDV